LASETESVFSLSFDKGGGVVRSRVAKKNNETLRTASLPTFTLRSNANHDGHLNITVTEDGALIFSAASALGRFGADAVHRQS